MTYPAEKLNALTATKTPALTIQVRKVGLISSTSGPTFRTFFVARRSLLLLRALRFRLDFSGGLVLVVRGDEE